MDIPHKVFTKKRENEVDENQMYNFRLLYIFKWWNRSSLAFEYYTRFMRFCFFSPFHLQYVILYLSFPENHAQSVNLLFYIPFVC